jgi:propanol-preferring alcohol dehydrogenase
VPGHEIVGRVLALGAGVSGWQVGDRAGVPWLAWTCGECEFCRRGEENLCTRAQFTGQHVDGGFATEVVADARFVLRLPDRYSDGQAAPLLCAGLIGWRALKDAGARPSLGLYGFRCRRAQVALSRVRADRNATPSCAPVMPRGSRCVTRCGVGGGLR